MSERTNRGRSGPGVAAEGGAVPIASEPGGAQPQPAANATAGPLLVVVGASAGGLEELQVLFGALTAPTGFAFVVVQHLDAEHASALAGILARNCPLPVADAVDGAPLLADRVLVMPSHADLEVHAGVVRLQPRQPAAGLHLPIDGCLHTAVAAQGARVIVVILSGDGRDGANGVVAVRTTGGLVFAQEPASAAHPAMPQATIDTGCADAVLPTAAIAAELVRLSRHRELLGSGPGDDGAAMGEAAANQEAAADAAALQSVLASLLAHGHVDFRVYRRTTIRRRVARRQALLGHATLAAYAAALASDAAECAALQADLLIGVTQFFREPATFAAIGAQVLPELLRERAADEPLRLWVPGCSTGEEAFSLAIVVHEYLQSIGSPVRLQIYASDVNPAAIATARTGRFSQRIAAAVGPARLARWFLPVEGGYQVVPALRESCVFTVHDLLEDPPFSRLDLISCRHVLMYLVDAQATVLRLFHYALNPAGFLVLGAAESPDLGDAFAVVDRGHGIYARRPAVRRAVPLPSAPRRRPGELALRRPFAGLVEDATESLRRGVDRVLLARCRGAAVLVGSALEVLEIRGDARAYLALPVGEVSYDLIKLMPTTGLFLQVEPLVRQVVHDGVAIPPRRVVFTVGGAVREVVLEVVPVHGPGVLAALVLFDADGAAAERAPAAIAPVAPSVGDAAAQTLVQLTAEVAEAHDRLRRLAERNREIEAEAASAAEEALSANEELRSLNEELETAKEELQSSNEELQAVNTELEHKNAALAKARDQALSIIGTVRQPLLVLDEELRVVICNEACQRVLGLAPAECEGRFLASLGGGFCDLPPLRSLLLAVRQGDAAPAVLEVARDVPGRGERTLAMSASRIPGLDMVLLAIDDVTQLRSDAAALRRAEEHLRQTQKMEAIGRLAGGIAHDFNNVLTVVQGYCELLCPRLARDATSLEMVHTIQEASERASALTRQLLAFGRRQVMQPRVLALDGVVADFDRLLQRLAGETIRCVVEVEPAPWRVRVDPAEFGRVLMNLALNARDAMPSGGTLTIRCQNVLVAAGDEVAADVPVGRCVLVEVEDTGVGMDAAAQAHLFEPFFTTKDASRGSGLGLSTVLGIVQQSGGAIRCRSTPGVGTCFRVWLPAVDAADELPGAPCRGTAPLPRGSEVVLLAEDEPGVRALSRRVLASSGYTVVEAANGLQALAAAERHAGAIALLVSDVMMPELGGVELWERLRRTRPGLPVLFVSGYTPDDRVRVAVAAGARFLSKPFTPLALASAVRAAIDGAAAGVPPRK
jgi:two-component system CheB/CheR fusion protein